MNLRGKGNLPFWELWCRGESDEQKNATHLSKFQGACEALSDKAFGSIVLVAIVGE